MKGKEQVARREKRKKPTLKEEPQRMRRHWTGEECFRENNKYKGPEVIKNEELRS